MMFKVIILLFYVCVFVSSDQGVEKNAVKNNSLANIPTNPKPEFITNKWNKSEETLKIQLYYESLCPGCRAFFIQSFLNTVIELRSYLDVHIYPYGNAQVLQNDSIVCDHGPEECYGNKLHACAIDYLDDIILAVIFNGCMMDKHDGLGSDDAAAVECGADLGIDSIPIKLCANSYQGEELLRFYGYESRQVEYLGVPTVLINGVHVDTNYFRSDVCNSFKIPPKPCRR